MSVPVLSEQTTETEPKVSTVLSDLQRILFFFIKFAVIVRPAVIEMGRPSGMKAIATLTQLTMRVGTLMKSGCSFLKNVALFGVSKRNGVAVWTPTYQMTQTRVIITIIMLAMMITK